MKNKDKILLTEMQLKILTLKVLGIGIIAYLLMMVVHSSGLYRLDAES